MSYTPIHMHSMYSVRDAVIKIKDLAATCAEYGIESCAITDHGGMWGAYKQYKTFKDYKIKPLIGCEFYVTDDMSLKEKHFHLVVIAKNMNGFKNLCALSSAAYLQGFYGKPRIDKTLLAQYKDDLICSSACIFGQPQQYLLNGQLDECIEEIKVYQTMFGEDYYLEIADHNMAEEDLVRDNFRNIGEHLGIKVVPATDSHYLKKEDKEFHNLFKQLAYNTVGRHEDDFPGTGYHLWTVDEMAAKFTTAEIANTNEIADKCSTKFEFYKYHLPKFKTPANSDAYEHLYHLSMAGMVNRGLIGNEEYEQRLKYEMQQLHLTELEDYFLIVSDYVKWCKCSGIPVGTARGSGGGSLVAWLVGITEVDPIRYDLLFARAINPGRALQYDFGV